MIKDGKEVVHVGGKTFFDGTSICKIRVYRFEDGTEEKEESSYPMREVSKEECMEMRKNKKAGVILRKDGKYFYAELPEMTNTKTNFGLSKHLCAFCNRCYAMPEEEGGCSKVMDLFPKREVYDKDRWEEDTCRIEKYDFIELGYEVFNGKGECLVVCECAHYGRSFDPKYKRNCKDFYESKLVLAQYLIPDAKTVKDAIRAIERGKKNLRN